MSHAEKSALWRELKAAGVELGKYQDYTTDVLRSAVEKLREAPGYVPPEQSPAPRPEPTAVQPPRPQPQPVHPNVPRSNTPTSNFAGAEAYKPQGEETPVRIDEAGNIWYREEVRKPAVPAPRKRRVHTYVDTGAVTESVKVGEYVETFEVAGTGTTTAEVKITLPSYQVGVYRDPLLPFRVHVYNGNKGFDLFDVHKFYGSADLVPAEIKRVYIANDLCYDIRTTIRAIQQEARDLTLKGQLR